MTVISVTNQKGGAAKTTTALELASKLAARNFKVLAIDNDAQGSLTLAANPHNVPFYFGSVKNFYADNTEEYFADIDQEAGPITIEDLIEVHKMDSKQIKVMLATTTRWPIYRIGNEFDLIPAPAKQSLAEVERSLLHTKLKEAIAQIKERFDYDFIIIDTPPALGILTVNALCAADYVLVPSNAEGFSTEGIVSLNLTVKSVIANANPALKYAGILITRVSPNTNVHSSYSDAIKKWAENNGIHVFSESITSGVIIPESQGNRIPLNKCKLKSHNAKAINEQYESFTDELLEVIGHGK